MYIRDKNGNYVPVPSIAGNDGREVELRTTKDYIQWRYKDLDWQDLISISDLLGPKGDPGKDAENIELRTNNGNIEWRLGDGGWQLLFTMDVYATIKIGNVVTGAPGTEASVVNTGTSSEAVLDFVIPRGDPGDSSQPHAFRHAANGSDPVTPTSIGALPISYVNAPDDFNDFVESGIYVCIDYDSALNIPWGGYYPTTVIVSWSETAGGGTQFAYDGYGSIAARSFKLENDAYVFDDYWEYLPTSWDLSSKAKKSISKTATLVADGWTGTEAPYSQTVDVSGMTAKANIVVTPNPISHSVWGEVGIYCSEQGVGNLTFVCNSVPSENITANILIVG